ncbi:MAG: MtrB/PioB family decaheme-associated outer membrane protein [Oxalobacteraceae bacterium]|nr:MtrB/PioB family decaheme-associated outer membrane protein [Oxalobacteraceae bacterium]
MNKNKHLVFPLAAMTAALLAVYGPVLAQESDEVTQLTTPSSTVGVGIAYLSKDAPRFGQYSGVRDEGAYGLVDVDIVKRNDDTGTWFKLNGRNLGFDSREMRVSHERQGDWGYFLDFSQTPRYEPYTVNTAVTGIGTANLLIPSTAAPVEVPVQLKTEREAIGLGFNKRLGNGFDVQVRARNEEKDGARLFARGTPGAFEFAPEPIDSATRQLEATVGYTGEKLQLTGGYYGTAYNNHNTALNITGGSAGLSSFSPIGLPPDNQSHQLSLAGGYSFNPTTRGSFKVARARATQDDTFVTAALPGNSDLGGRVDTTLAQMGITARPIEKLSLLANLRYEDRDDKTPVRRYSSLATATSTFNGDNEPRSIKTTAGKFEASYRLPMTFRLTGGIDYEEKERSASPVRIVSQRDKTRETSYRAELRRSMSETVTGAIAFIRSDRDGSDFQTTVLNNGATGSNLIAPLHLADRQRDKVRLSLNWTPTDELSLQFIADQTRDDYGQRTAAALGIREGESENYSLDASYAFSEAWQANAWASINDNRSKQASAVSANLAQIWAANLSSKTNAYGIGMHGKISSRLQIGADLSHADIKDKYQQQAITGAARTPLPNVSTRLTSVKLFGNYALDKSSSVRLDYVYERYNTNDWTWSNWTYADGTQLSQNPNQNVNFIGVSYIYKFQ